MSKLCPSKLESKDQNLADKEETYNFLYKLYTMDPLEFREAHPSAYPWLVACIERLNGFIK